MLSSLRLRGELSFEPRDREAHSEDASMYRREPLAVAYPRDAQDCAVILTFCRSENLSVHPWGAGTSRGGQPLGPGLVVDFRRHLNRILSFEDGILTVEPGATYAEVQKFLRARGRSFPPDPSYHQCTIGGMIANNAAGIRSVKYGGTAENLAALEFLTADGELHSTDVPDALAERVGIFLRRHRETITRDFPSVEKNSSGYSFDRALRADGTTDLARLLAGSEGTLALLTRCRLRTVPLAEARSLAVLYFASLEDALRAALAVRPAGISACELVDKVLLDLHGAAHGGSHHAKKIADNEFLDSFYYLGAEAILVVETEGDSSAVAGAALAEAIHLAAPFSLRADVAATEAVGQKIWDLRRHTSPILNRLEDGKISIKPLWGVEDVSLPRETFLAYVREQRALFERLGLTCSFFGHAASCNLHIDPLAVDPRRARLDAELARLYDEAARESYALVVRHGGSISGEHGDGLSRTPYLALQYPRAAPLFAELKTMFDPYGILNPGKIVT